MAIIGINGRIGSGKDTLGEMIQELDPTFQIRVFAEKLKEICAILSGRPLSDMYSQEGKNIFLPEWNMTVGEMLQQIGTDVMRNHFHPDVWVKSLFSEYLPSYLYKYKSNYYNQKQYDRRIAKNDKNIAKYESVPIYPNWVITDVRFPNEARSVLERGHFLVRITGDPIQTRANSKRDLNHASETSLDNWTDWDYEVDNSGTLEDLRRHAIIIHNLSLRKADGII